MNDAEQQAGADAIDDAIDVANGGGEYQDIAEGGNAVQRATRELREMLANGREGIRGELGKKLVKLTNELDALNRTVENNASIEKTARAKLTADVRRIDALAGRIETVRQEIEEQIAGLPELIEVAKQAIADAYNEGGAVPLAPFNAKPLETKIEALSAGRLRTESAIEILADLSFGGDVDRFRAAVEQKAASKARESGDG